MHKGGEGVGVLQGNIGVMMRGCCLVAVWVVMMWRVEVKARVKDGVEYYIKTGVSWVVVVGCWVDWAMV